MLLLGWILLALAPALVLYAYALYPLLLWASGRRAARPVPQDRSDWPFISITVPVYNEEAQVRGLVESLLRIDYPEDRRQILIVSDASTDRTDEIVAEYAHRGVELLRVPERGGKTAAENAAASHLRGEIVVNTDASIRIRPDAVKPLVARFADPSVGVSSGRDLSIGQEGEEANAGESGYVGYEMWVRALETRVSGIIGASGCLYAIRADLHHAPLRATLTRDFAATLLARRRGYRAVSVDEAVCYVPRASSLQREYRRKVRTITNGLETLVREARMLNPFAYGAFAWMLWSHKACRWAVPWAALLSVVGLGILAFAHLWAAIGLGLVAVVALLGAIGWRRSAREAAVPALFAIPAFALAGNVAVLHATLRLLNGRGDRLWEPTRRDVISMPSG